MPSGRASAGSRRRTSAGRRSSAAPSARTVELRSHSAARAAAAPPAWRNVMQASADRRRPGEQAPRPEAHARGRAPPPTRPEPAGRTRSRAARAARPVRSRRSRPRPSARPAAFASRAATTGAHEIARPAASPDHEHAANEQRHPAHVPACCIEMAASASVGPSTSTTSAVVMAASTTTSGCPESEPSAGAARSAAELSSIDDSYMRTRKWARGRRQARPVIPGYTSFLMSWEMMRNLVRDEWVILSLSARVVSGRLGRDLRAMYALWNVVPKSEAFKNRVIDALERGDIAKATALCEMSQVPIADVFERGLLVLRQDAGEDDGGGDVPAKRDRADAQALSVGARHRGIIGAVRRPVRNRGRHPQGVPIDVRGRHGRLQGRVAGDRGRAGGHRGRPAGRDLRGHRLQLFRRTDRRRSPCSTASSPRSS